MRSAATLGLSLALLGALGCADIVGADFGSKTVRAPSTSGGNGGSGGSGTGGAGAGCAFECCTNMDCFNQHNAPYICRQNACVSLTTPECSEVVGEGYKNDNVFLLGWMDTLSGAPSQSMAGLNHAAAAKLAAKEFQGSASGSITSGDGTLAPLSMILCDEAGDNAAKSGAHLVDDLGVKAILGPTFDTAYKDFLNNYANTGKAFLLSSSTENPDFPANNTMGLGWSCSPNIRADFQTIWHEIGDGEKAVRERRKLTPDQPVRLVMVAAGDPASQAGNIELIQGMTLNGKPVAEQDANFLYFSYDDPAVKPVDYGKVVAQILAFKPDLILPYGGPDISATIIPQTEMEYASAAFEDRPIWMLYFVQDPAFVDLACGVGATTTCAPPGVDDFRRRIFGFGSVSENVTLRVSFGIGFKAANNNQSPLPFAAATYDSYYVLAYALQAAAAANKTTAVKDLTPQQIAAAMPMLTPPMGSESIEVGGDNIGNALQKLQSGAAINLEGASGHLDFQTKPLPDTQFGLCSPGTTLELWCIAPKVDPTTKGFFVSNGEVYDAAADTFGTPKFPIYECQNPM